ncbi:MAG: peptide chain release factor 1 [Planctomycetota bacterium]|jgi:peptide chain release factor 1
MKFEETIVDKVRQQAARHAELEVLLADPDVASDHKRYPLLVQEQGMLREAASLTGEMEDLLGRRAEAEAALADKSDPELVELAKMELEELPDLEQDLEERIKSELVSDPELNRDRVIVELRAGTGGDEATLFTADLLRMYQRYSDEKRWKLELMSLKGSEVGGYKEVFFGLRGEGVWRLLRFESGGHRVQRVPSTESAGRVHTSAATVAVLPEAEEVDLEIRREDLRIDTMRAGGAGGQHVNKTESAVRITYLPTNTVVICQDESSQHKNRAQAMRILRSRVLEAERQRLHDERAASRKSQIGSGDRSERVRTYNFPQNRCSDHRLSQNFALEPVLSGKLGPILEALAEVDRSERIAAL